MSYTAKTDTSFCTYCLADKPVADFYVRKEGRQAGRLTSHCKRCVGFLAAKRAARLPGDQMVRAAKFRAKQAGLPYDLDEHRAAIRERVLSGCELSGLPFTIEGPRSWDSPSIDRIKPELGYVIGNVRIIMWCLNSLFGYWGEHNAEIAVRAWLARKD